MKCGIHRAPRRSVVSVVFCLLLAPVALRGQQNDFDAWRENFGSRLDESIAKLRSEEETERMPPINVASSRTATAEGQAALPPPLADNGKQNRFPFVQSILRENGLPASLMAVVAVESGFNAAALSPKGARGLWQLMPETARRYGLAVEPGRDDRLDPVKSTHAAARYMKDLYAQFQDWPLTLAAYNAGENRVERALDRRGTADFWTLSRLAALPEETRRYVPAVLAKLEAPLNSWDPPATSPLAKYAALQGRVVYASPTNPQGFESK